MNAQTVYLSSAYFGPVIYYSKVMNFARVEMEQFESYNKQTYRNRCAILGANGAINLTVPVVKNSGKKTLFKDVQIAYDMPWQSSHWQSIVSAYNSSPYFEYYSDELKPFFTNSYKFLIDLNWKVHEVICEILEIDMDNQALTDDFLPVNELGNDYRFSISPKVDFKKDTSFQSIPYTQTFADKFGFLPNLSILDVIFNAGPEAESILKQSFV